MFLTPFFHSLRQFFDYTTVAKTAIMFGIGIPELVVIFLVALVILGPNDSGSGKIFGKTLADFRKSDDEMSAELSAMAKCSKKKCVRPNEQRRKKN